MKPIRLSLLLCLSMTTPAAFSASFDCAKAASSTEKLICSSTSLSNLDSQLQIVYESAANAAAAPSKPALLKEQRNWIRYVRNICENETCLGDAYKSRIALLQHNDKYLVNKTSCDIPDGKTCRSVVFYRDPAARVESFNRSLVEQKQGGKIIGCSKLVDLPVGTASGNHSFGGICILQTGTSRSDVKICNDDMVGHFSIQKVDAKSASEKDLIDFTNTQCFGG